MVFYRTIHEFKTTQGLAKLYHYNLDYEGPSLLFIHGFGGSSEIWFRYPESLGNYLKEKGADVWSLGFSKAKWGDIRRLAHEDLYSSINFIYQQNGMKPLRVIAHSIGGIIIRYLLAPHLFHPYSLDLAVSMLNGVTLLATPNHGVNVFRYDKIWSVMNLLINHVKFNQLFVQILRYSDLIDLLNTDQHSLNPNVRWQNAIGIFDHIVDINSAKFEKRELSPDIDIKQKEFPVDHLEYPLKTIIAIFNDVYPAIHRYPPIAEWILEHLHSRDGRKGNTRDSVSS